MEYIFHSIHVYFIMVVSMLFDVDSNINMLCSMDYIYINDSSILITIISCDYLNLSLTNEYVGDVTIPNRLSSIKKNSQPDQPIRF
jgi:hypothetical protein